MSDITEALDAIEARAKTDPSQQLGDPQTDRDYLLALCRRILNEAEAAWDDGYKQGGPMHDVNYDDPAAHSRNPYRTTLATK
jgi:hypothetical protein